MTVAVGVGTAVRACLTVASAVAEMMSTGVGLALPQAASSKMARVRSRSNLERLRSIFPPSGST